MNINEAISESTAGTIGYLIPEFPGQTHIWMWREITHLREWGVPIQLFSTRRPPQRDRARHAFADAATKETTYLWPEPPRHVIIALLWALFSRPLQLLRCFHLAWTLPIDKGKGQRRKLIALIAVACKLARELKKRRVVHLHCHTCAYGAVLAMMAKRLAGVPYSMTLNANLEWWGGGMFEKMSEAEFTVAITQRLLSQIQKDYPSLSPGQSLLGRIGVDTRKWVRRRVRKADQDAFRVISVGRLHPSKGYDVLLHAISDLKQSGRKIELHIVGEGPERANLESLVQTLDIAEEVHFAGSLSEDQIIARMEDADMFALASRAEPLGVVYMEAMAMGLPTIGTAAGGVPEIIENGVNGWLVPSGDSKALAELMLRLMDDPASRAAVARCGTKAVQEKFDSRVGAATLYREFQARACCIPNETPAGLGDSAAEGAVVKVN